MCMNINHSSEQSFMHSLQQFSGNSFNEQGDDIYGNE